MDPPNLRESCQECLAKGLNLEVKDSWSSVDTLNPGENLSPIFCSFSGLYLSWGQCQMLGLRTWLCPQGDPVLFGRRLLSWEGIGHGS
jgi:hypothetical protein